MAKLSTIDLNAFEMYANVIKKQHRDMLEARKSYIIAMYKILKENEYSRIGAIKSIHTTLAEKFDSLYEVKREYIEQVTEGLK